MPDSPARSVTASRERILPVLLFLFLPAVFYTPNVKGEDTMHLTSPVFEPQGEIPKEYTCQGPDINPELHIDGVPEGAQTLALIMDDPDAPMGTWDHWIVFNIKPRNVIPKDSVPGVQGVNDFKRNDYGGPCPPMGKHRYFFKLYALDTALDLPEGATKRDVEKAMEGHILDRAELVGVYQKQ